MELRDIEYFAVIAEHRHLGRAAEALGLGQPALSLSLRRLEKSADARLIHRTPKGLELTAVGSALLSHVQRLQLAREDLAKEIAYVARGQVGRLRIGANANIANGLLADACSVMLKEAPGVTLNVVVAGETAALVQTLRKGELDLIVSFTSHGSHEGVTHERLCEVEFVVYASIRHRLARRKSVSLGDLVNERWVSTPGSALTARNSLRHTFEERGLPAPQIAVMSDSAELSRQLVAGSDLLGFAARRPIARNAKFLGLKILQISDMTWTRFIVIACRTSGYQSPVAKRFIDILRKLGTQA
jgi:DNA-binding transcriptional LysR family regulator